MGNCMRKLSIDSNIVFCDICKVQWCELCLTKNPLTKTCTNYKNNNNNNTNNSNKHINNNNNNNNNLDDNIVDYNDEYDVDDHDCDPYNVLMLCQKYTTSSKTIKARYEKKYHWIREYSQNRLQDIMTYEWAKENASICP